MSGGAYRGATNEMAHDPRGHEITKPPDGASKAGAAQVSQQAEPPANSASTTTGANGANAKTASKLPPPSAVAAPKPAAPKANTACDPPYTIDPATGRKKYKLECLK